MSYSATDQRRVARLTIDDLYDAERDARHTADQLVVEIAELHVNGRGNDPLCTKLMADLAVVHARIKRLEGMTSAAENDLDAEQWL